MITLLKMAFNMVYMKNVFLYLNYALKILNCRYRCKWEKIKKLCKGTEH